MYHADRRSGAVVGPRVLARRFAGLSEELLQAADRVFPVRVTRSWLARMTGGVDSPLGRQVLPSSAELRSHPGDVPDPVGEAIRSPIPWVVQKHPDRVLLLVTRRCHLYCRYCFRRDQHGPEEPTEAELEAALEFARHSGAREAILSGGDPLTLSDRKLFRIIDELRPALPLIRVHSRAPISAPDRVTDGFVRQLRERAPVWLVVHANHPDELSSDVEKALARLLDAGVPVLNQSVLLKGVNDDPGVLTRLSERLVELRVRPYYLHHTDAVPGNARFRVSIEEGLKIHAQLAEKVSGIGLPRYVIDPPDGSGKTDVATWAARGGGHPVPSGAQEY